MRRLSPLLFVIVLSTQLLAQSRNDGLDAAATNLISNVATYCNTVEWLASKLRNATPFSSGK